MSTPSRTSAPDKSRGSNDCSSKELQSAIDNVRSFKDLEPNWDSYGALIIDPDCRQTAVQFLRQLDPGIPIPSPVPTVRGGVQLEWHCQGVDFEIEFQPSGEWGVYFEDLQTGESEEFELAGHWDGQTMQPFLDRLARER